MIDGMQRKLDLVGNTCSIFTSDRKTPKQKCGRERAQGRRLPRMSLMQTRFVYLSRAKCPQTDKIMKAGDVTKLHKLLPAVISRAEEVFVDLPNDRDAGNGTTKALLELLSSKEGHTNLLHKGESRKLRSLMDELRVIKSDTEVENMRIAGKASGRAITKTMRLKYATEKAVASFLEYSIRKHGCEGLAYIPVVASGSVSMLGLLSFAEANEVTLERPEYTLHSKQ